MFCPRCGVQITETTKFCKSCGMAIAQVMDFVASGGTAPLTASATSSLTSALSGFSSSQKMWLIVLLLIFSPIWLSVLPFLVPVAIVWLVLEHNKQKRLLNPPAAAMTYQPPQLQTPPVNQLYQPTLSAPQPVTVPTTGSLTSPPSVVEEETKRLSK